MIQTFNAFNQSELKILTLCNPNKDEICPLPLAHTIKNTIRYNALSELSFDYPQSQDGGVTKDVAYDLIAGKKLVLVEDVGYYIVRDASEDNDGSVPVKHVSCHSLEAELMTSRLTGFSGTYQFSALLVAVLALKPNWTIGTIDSSLTNLYRTFSSNNSTVYGFLMNEVEKAYGCIFEFDSFTRTVSAIPNVIPSANTNIVLSFDNLIEKTEFKEITEELATCLYCYGGGDLDIRNVNPLGGTAIYDFDYFKTSEWMSAGLISALNAWEAKVDAYQPTYANYLSDLETHNGQILSLETELVELNGQLKSMTDVREVRIQQGLPTTEIDAQIAAQQVLITSKLADISSEQSVINSISIELRKIVHDLYFTSRQSFGAFYSDVYSMFLSINKMLTDWVNVYPSTSTSPNFNPTLLTTLTPQINALMLDANNQVIVLRDALYAQFAEYPLTPANIALVTGYINNVLTPLNSVYALFQSLIPNTSVTDSIDSIRNELFAYLTIITYGENFTDAQFSELSNYIWENSYTNSNITTNDLMTPVDVQSQSQYLYDQSQTVLAKTAAPRYEFSGTFANFVLLKEFSDFTDELSIGKVINIRKDDTTTIEAVLLEISITYDNPDDFSLVFSNRFRLDNSEFIYGDIFGTAAQLGSNTGSTTISEGNIAGWTVTQGALSLPNATIASDGYVSFGVTPPTSYGNYEGAWLGFSDAPKFSLFSNINNYLQWDGTKLLVKAENFSLDSLGTITATNANLSGKITAASGEIGGWTIGATRIYTAHAYLDSGEYLSFGTAPPTSYGDNVGVWLGYSGAPKLSLYADSSNYLQWDGTKLLIKSSSFQLDASGNMIANSGQIGGWTIGATSLTAGTGSSTVALDSGGVNPAIYAGSATPASAPFRVYSDGSVWLGSGQIGFDLQSTSFLSGSYGWKIEQSGHAEFNDITLRGNISSVVFERSQINTISGDVFITDGAVLISSVLPGDTVISVDVDTFQSGDVVQLSTGGQSEWMTIGGNGIPVASGYSYAVTRDISGFGEGTFYPGDVVIRSGSSSAGSLDLVGFGEYDAGFGEYFFGTFVSNLGGYLDLNGTRGFGPYFGVYIRTGPVYNQIQNIARFGNMNGFLGYTSEVYGIGIGDTNRHLRYTFDDGLEILTLSGATVIDDDGILTNSLLGALDRVLGADFTIENTRCMVVSGYFDISNHALTIDGDGILEIL